MFSIIPYSNSIFKLKSLEYSDFNEINSTVSRIILSIAQKGDEAVLRYNAQFDNNHNPKLRVTEEEIRNAHENCDEKFLSNIKYAIERVRNYHQKQLPDGYPYNLDYDEGNINFCERWQPISRVGLYIPGGSAVYPSSIIMNVIPAQIANVPNIALITPAMNGEISNFILATAFECGIQEIYRTGGAHGIAAIALGTNSIAKVDKIFGPGNAYVTEAKRQLYGIVGIDSLAGPSDITILASEEVNPKHVVADLFAQAEHGELSSSILVTNSSKLAEDVNNIAKIQLEKMNRRNIIASSIKNFGKIILCQNLDKEGVNTINNIAPEHLQIMMNPSEERDKILKNITNAGAIFVGKYCNEILGDYVLGPSHTLPTSSTAKFDSGLSVYDFLKLIRISTIDFNSEEIKKMNECAMDIAYNEQLDAHAFAAKIRIKE